MSHAAAEACTQGVVPLAAATDADRRSPSAALAVVQPAINWLGPVHMHRTVKYIL